MSQQEWQEVVVKDVCESVIDCVNKTAPVVDYVTPYRMIRTTNVKNGVIDTENVRYVEKETYEKWTRRAVPQVGDVILTREAPLGDVGMLTKPGEHIFLGQRLMQYRTDLEKLDNYFLLYALQDSYMQGQLKAAGSGSTVEHVRVGDAESLKIRIPDINTQRQLSSILRAYDELIENNNRRIAILEEMTQSLYREWFVKFRFPGHDQSAGEPIGTAASDPEGASATDGASQNAKFIDSPLGKIPEGWEVKSVGELLEFDIGGGWGKDVADEKHTEAAYVIRGTDLQSVWMGDVDALPYRYHTKSNIKTRRLQENDIVFEASGGSKGQPVGRTTRVTKELVGAIGDDVICASFCKLIRAKQRSDAYILLSHIREMYADQRILKYQVQSTGISNFKFKVFCESELLVVPSGDIARQYGDSYGVLTSFAQKLAFSNRNLKKQRDLLLPKLVSGKISLLG